MKRWAFLCLLSLCMVGIVEAIGKKYDSLGVYVYLKNDKWYFMGLISIEGDTRFVFAVDKEGKKLVYEDSEDLNFAGGFEAIYALTSDVVHRDKIFIRQDWNDPDPVYLYINYKSKPPKNVEATKSAQKNHYIYTATAELSVQDYQSWEKNTSKWEYGMFCEPRYHLKWDVEQDKMVRTKVGEAHIIEVQKKLEEYKLKKNNPKEDLEKKQQEAKEKLEKEQQEKKEKLENNRNTQQETSWGRVRAFIAGLFNYGTE